MSSFATRVTCDVCAAPRCRSASGGESRGRRWREPRRSVLERLASAGVVSKNDPRRVTERERVVALAPLPARVVSGSSFVRGASLLDLRGWALPPPPPPPPLPLPALPPLPRRKRCTRGVKSPRSAGGEGSANEDELWPWRLKLPVCTRWCFDFSRRRLRATLERSRATNRSMIMEAD